ncbi:MAG: TadE family protein [Candidatus Dormibacteria bacterium]
MTAAGRRRRRGQTLVEFAMVFPVFLMVVMGTIDYGGYFGSRLSIENAARAAVRYAAVQPCPLTGAGVTTAGNNACWTNVQPPGAGTIEAQAIAAANDAKVTNEDCPDQDGAWPPSAADLATLTPDTGCISIRYYDLNASADTCTGGPGTCQLTLCAVWSASADQLQVQSGFTLGNNCMLTAGSGVANIVQVLIGYDYQPMTPVPRFLGAVMTTTSAETQLILEQV